MSNRRSKRSLWRHAGCLRVQQKTGLSTQPWTGCDLRTLFSTGLDQSTCSSWMAAGPLSTQPMQRPGACSGSDAAVQNFCIQPGSCRWRTGAPCAAGLNGANFGSAARRRKRRTSDGNIIGLRRRDTNHSSRAVRYESQNFSSEKSGSSAKARPNGQLVKSQKLTQNRASVILRFTTYETMPLSHPPRQAARCSATSASPPATNR